MTTITYAQYLQLLGLLTLAERHNQALDDIKQATVALLPIRAEDHDWVLDAIYGDKSADALLERFGITVEPRTVEASNGSEQP